MESTQKKCRDWGDKESRVFRLDHQAVAERRAAARIRGWAGSLEYWGWRSGCAGRVRRVWDGESGTASLGRRVGGGESGAASPGRQAGDWTPPVNPAVMDAIAWVRVAGNGETRFSSEPVRVLGTGSGPRSGEVTAEF